MLPPCPRKHAQRSPVLAFVSKSQLLAHSHKGFP